MKKTIIATLALLALASSSAFAASATLNTTANIGSPAITVQVDQDATLKNFKTDGKLSYADTDTEWVSAQMKPAKIQFTGDPNRAFSFNIPSSAVLTHTNGTDTATLTLDCRYQDSGYVADKTLGVACGTSGTSNGAGSGYNTIYPVAITYSASNTAGVYSGVIPADIDYL